MGEDVGICLFEFEEQGSTQPGNMDTPLGSIGKAPLSVGCRVKLINEGTHGLLTKRSGAWWHVSLDDHEGIVKRRGMFQLQTFSLEQKVVICSLPLAVFLFLFSSSPL